MSAGYPETATPRPRERGRGVLSWDPRPRERDRGPLLYVDRWLPGRRRRGRRRARRGVAAAGRLVEAELLGLLDDGRAGVVAAVLLVGRDRARVHALGRLLQ